MKELDQLGYFKLNISETETKTLHFSMVCWLELQKDTGVTIDKWAEGFEGLDAMQQIDKLADIVFASAKAYDLENGNPIDYNKYNVINWVANFNEADGEAFMAAMMFSIRKPNGLGKPKKAKQA